MSSSYFDTTPKPNAEFSNANSSHTIKGIYLGEDAEKNLITHIGLSSAPVYKGEKSPVNLRTPSGDYATGGANSGEQWVSKKLESGWNSTITLVGVEVIFR